MNQVSTIFMLLICACIQNASAFAPLISVPSSLVTPTQHIIISTRSTSSNIRTILAESKSVDDQPSLFSKLVSNVKTAASDGFGTSASNVGSTMKVGDVVVPLVGNLDKRQSLAQIGLYAGVEYLICDITSTMEKEDGEEGDALTNGRIATIKPAYPLRDHLERSDWPISLPVSDVPLWLPRATYEAGTAVGTLALAGTYLSIALVISTFLRIVVVPSESMMPELMPRDVVLVTRSIFTKPKANDVVFFNPPAELDLAIANSKIGRAAAKEREDASKGNANIQQSEKISIVSTKGKQFLKRIVGVPGDIVGVYNSNPYVKLCNDGGDTDDDCTYRIDRTGSYSRPDVFPDESWNRVKPTINLGNGEAESNESSTLAKGQYFVAGDNGYRSVDSRVWGPLNEKNIFGTAKWIILPVNHFGPIQPGPFVRQNQLIEESANQL